jgi:conjugative transposon TraK protein
MFKKFKSMDESFRQVRWLSLGSMLLSAVVSSWAVYFGISQIEKAGSRIYVLFDDKVFAAVATDRRENLPVIARSHIRAFHRYFFNLDPDEKAIRVNMDRAFYLADGSAKTLYNNQLEKGFIAGLISGNISQSVVLDSIWLDLSSEPYAFYCTGSQLLTRATSITTRSFVTKGSLRSVEASDNNPDGFLIEGFEVVENKDLKTQNR